MYQGRKREEAINDLGKEGGMVAEREDGLKKKNVEKTGTCVYKGRDDK